MAFVNSPLSQQQSDDRWKAAVFGHGECDAVVSIPLLPLNCEAVVKHPIDTDTAIEIVHVTAHRSPLDSTTSSMLSCRNG